MAIPITACRLDRWKERGWAVFSPEGDLVCVTLYRKGAEEVIRRLGIPSASIVPEGEEAPSGSAPPTRGDAAMKDDIGKRTG